MNGLLRYWLGRPRPARPLDAASLRRVLLVQVDNKIGDLMVATSLLRNLQRAGAEVDVLTRPACAAILQHNPAVHHVYGYTKKPARTLGLLRQLRARRYDLAITLEEHDSSTTLSLIKLIGARHNLGFFKAHWPLFDLSLEHGAYAGHITDKYRSILQRLGVPADDMRYDFVAPAVDAGVLDAAGDGPRIILNCYGSTADKTLQHDAAVALLAALRQQRPDCRLYLLDAPGQRERTVQLAAASGAVALPAYGSIAEAAAQVRKAALLISTDTAWLHIASALQLPVLALYAEARNLHTWAAHRTRHAGLLATGPAAAQFDAQQAAQTALGLI